MTEPVQAQIENVLAEIKEYEKEITQFREKIERSEKRLLELIKQNYSNQYKIVKRTAHVGDTIMIIREDPTGTERYKIGDIHKVLARYDLRVFIDKTEEVTGDNIRIIDGDYVVLEAIE